MSPATATLTTVLLVGMLLSPATAGAGAGGHEENRALRDVVGVVVRIDSVSDDEGRPWLESVLETGDGEHVRIRLAPRSILADERFSLEAGDRTRARIFVGDEPLEVARIRNVDRGRTLRLRCLHGHPTWLELPPAVRDQGRRAPGGGKTPERRGRR